MACTRRRCKIKLAALVTGSEGFVGGYLVHHLLGKKLDVIGTYLNPPKVEINDVKYIPVDIREKDEIRKVLSTSLPYYIFHLAAKTSTPYSFRYPQETFSTNIIGTINLYESIRELKEKESDYDPLIIYAGSSEAFGQVKEEEIPLDENQPFRPVSPYGASKAAASLISYQYFKAFNLRIVRLNLFTHTGPGQKSGFFVSDIASQIAKIEKTGGELRVGNLESIRDYSDVRDIVEAYWLAALKCEPGEAYNVCSGKKTPIKKILDILISFSSKKIKVVIDSGKFRKVETPLIVGNTEKFRKKTLWKNQIPLQKTLKDTLNWWRKAVLQG